MLYYYNGNGGHRLQKKDARSHNSLFELSDIKDDVRPMIVVTCQGGS